MERQTLLVFNDAGQIIEESSFCKQKNEKICIKLVKELTPQQKRLLTNKSELTLHSEGLGGYIHMNYKENDKLFSELDIDLANISRLVYLATYIDYNTREENLLIKRVQGSKRVPMTRQDIQDILVLKDTAFKAFLKDMRDSKLLFEVDRKFYLSNKLFTKGKCNFEEYTRVFIDTTRDLYRGTTSRQHKLLGQALQLIPYLHFDSNVLCKNPKEQDYTKREKLSLEDIANILGVKCEKSVLSKLKKSLESLKVNVNGQELPLFKYVPKPYDYFVLNSYVVWKGNDIAKMKENIQFYFFR